MIPSLQCIDCIFNLVWDTDNFPGKYKCEQYPETIPKYVEYGEDGKSCPRFESKE